MWAPQVVKSLSSSDRNLLTDGSDGKIEADIIMNTIALLKLGRAKIA